ncbi:Ribonuclease 3 [Pleomorphomonas sp. T1.2MG-36]|uniref:ribonuclease III n=1 Tax=Pleomorphomonas sp. T1.2MG-36 TaxID=3041167 RepID=UPI00247775B7|nr:ribonuclease III [Pleomorphomonas sp. T1.2MG-36]CAI9398806.1 Ribonuclease 3 [Pleomorphomonas sp. T1.2MG-36]
MNNHQAQVLEALEGRLQYHFKDRTGLLRALTHRSAVPGDQVAHESYQRHEFLGDRVLALVVAEMLFSTYPREEEGDLARRLNQLVRRETCAEVASDLDLGSVLRLGAGERQSGGRRKEAILGDVAEAVIAAIYLDGGFDAAKDFVLRNWKPRMESLSGPLRDSKTLLQEWAQGRGQGLPGYSIVERSGPDHAPMFRVLVTIDGEAAGEGQGKSKREAEQAAAAEALAKRAG